MKKLGQSAVLWSFSGDPKNPVDDPYGYKAKRSSQGDSIANMMWERMQSDTIIRTEYAQRKAANCEAIGLYEMGIRYLNGWGTNVDIKGALDSLDGAARQGHAGACYELAKQYVQGNHLINIQRDLDRAKQYISYGKDKRTTEYDTPNYKQESAIIDLINLEKTIHAIQVMRAAPMP